MSGLKQFTPPSVKGMNFNIDADLELTGSNGLKTAYVRIHSGTYTPPPSYGGILCDIDNASLAVLGGTNTASGGIVLFGRSSATPGQITFVTVDNTLASVAGFYLKGGIASPYLDMNSHRITALGPPTTDNDALPYQAWAAYSSLTHTWTGATPASWSYTFRYMKIGKTCFYSYQGSSTDSNATTGLSITVMPYTAANTINYHGQWTEGTGAGGTTFNDAIGYVPANSASVQFLKWVTPTDGQALYLQGTGFYEVA